MRTSNDVLHETLTNDGNDSYAYVDDLDEAQKLFVENLTSTLHVIVLNVLTRRMMSSGLHLRMQQKGYPISMSISAF